MKVVAFLTEYAVVDRIMEHLKLTFVAEKPPPAQIFEQVALIAAEESGDYDKRVMPRGGLSRFGRFSAVLTDNPSVGIPALRILSS